MKAEALCTSAAYSGFYKNLYASCTLFVCLFVFWEKKLTSVLWLKHTRNHSELPVQNMKIYCNHSLNEKFLCFHEKGIVT